MRTLSYTISALLLLLVVTGCDPRYDIDYKVTNQTEGSIKIVVDYLGSQSDTNVITPGTTLLFYTDFGIGYADCILDELKTPPVGLSIFNHVNIPYNKDVSDISLWEKTYPERKDNDGMVQLTVRPADFE